VVRHGEAIVSTGRTLASGVLDETASSTPACSGIPNSSKTLEYARDGIDFICFTDDPELRSDFMENRTVAAQGTRPRARREKK